jgi:hypothetical protein
MKTCTRCSVEQPLSEFHKYSEKGTHRNQCRTCIKKADAQACNPMANHSRLLQSWLLRKHG